jgi:hypothetical protein
VFTPLLHLLKDGQGEHVIFVPGDENGTAPDAHHHITGGGGVILELIIQMAKGQILQHKKTPFQWF